MAIVNLLCSDRVFVRLIEGPADLIKVALTVCIQERVSMGLIIHYVTGRKHLRMVAGRQWRFVVFRDAMLIAGQVSDSVLVLFMLLFIVVVLALAGVVLRS
jgi:hypothetical protein